MDEPFRPSGGPGGATMSRNAVIVSAAITAVVAFVVGFGFAIGGGSDGGGEDDGDLAVAVTTTEVVAATEPTVTAPDTIATDTTLPPESTVAPRQPTTSLPPPTEAPVVTDAPPVTAAPALLTAQYPRDSADRLVMNKGGTVQVTVSNVGGSLGQWLVQASGYVFVEGVNSGTLQPGQSVQVRLRGAPDVPPVSPQGTLTISGGRAGQLIISVLVL